MLVAHDVFVRVDAALVGPFDGTLDPGRTVALLGDRAASVLLATLAGRQRPARGTVQHARGSAVSARAHVAHVGRGVPALPLGLRVSELASPAVLARFSLARLARTRTELLALEDARAVAMALALTGSSSIVALDEPLVQVAPEAAGAVRAGLRDPARLVLFKTSSVELAGAADLVVPVGAAASPHAEVLSVRVAAGIGRFAAALPYELVLEVRADAAGAGTVRVAGPALAAARAIARAAASTATDVRALHAEAP